MVREELAKYLNTTVKIEATFIKESVSKGGKFKTVLLRQIFLQETKTFVTDHVWISSNVNFFSNLKPNAKITFMAKVEKPNVEKKVKNESKEEKTIYGIKVSKGINQTLIWKVLKKVYENKDEEGIKIVKELKNQYPEVFENAVKCLVSKKRINYINSIC